MPQQIHHQQDAEVLLNTLLGVLPDVGIVTWDAQGSITSLSKGCRLLMQLPTTARVGGPIGVIGQSPCRTFLQTYEAFRKGLDKTVVEEVFKLSRDGESYWLKLSLRRCPEACEGNAAFLLIVRDVTTQRRSIEWAQRAQGYFEAALRAIPDAAVFTDNQGCVTKASAGVERIFGYEETELQGRSLGLLAGDLYRLASSVADGETAHSPDIQMIEAVAKNGRRFSSEVVTDTIRDADGNALGVVAVLRDVSERLALQDDLLKQTTLLDRIFRQLPFALSVVDTERRTVQMTDAALALLGYRQDQVVNQSARMLYQTQEEFERAGRAMYVETPGGPVVADMVDAAGRGFKGRIQVAPLYDSGKVLRGHLVAVEDVTAQIAHEEELHRYEQMVSASRDALVLLDNSHIYRAVNQAYLELWNKSRDEIIGSHISDIVGERIYLDYTRPALRKCFSGEAVALDAVEVDFADRKRFFDVRYAPYRSEQGEIAGVLITLRDVTQRHLAERAIQESQQRIEQAGVFAEFAVWELDVESRRPVDDSMLRRLLGYSEEDPLDSLEDWLNLVAESDRQYLAESYESILAGPGAIERLEYRAFKKTGELVYLETLVEGRLQDGKRKLVGISRDITELVNEREALRRYEHMTMATQDGLALVDQDHVYRAVNGFYTRMHGISTEEIVGKPVAWLLGEKLYGEVVKPMMDRCFCGEDAEIELWVDYRRRGRRRVEVSSSPYRDESGRITSVLVTKRDITERYLSQLAMKESEEKFRAIFDHTPIGVVVLSVDDGAIIAANPASLRMYGYERDEYLHLKLYEVVVGVTPDNFAREWRRVTERRRSRFESEHRRKDGSRMHVLADASRMQFKGREVIISTLVDVTKQKHLELRLREQQNQYRMLVDSSNAILFSAEPETMRFSFVSPEAEKLLGYPGSTWSEDASFWINHLHPDDRHWVPEYCASRVRRHEDHDFDFRMIAADGRVVWLHDSISVIVEEGRVVSLVGVMVDITNIKQAEAEVRRLSEMVEQSADAILLTDTDFRISYINEAFTQLYGYSLEDLRGQRPEILNAEPDAEAIHPQIYNGLLAGRRLYRQLLNSRKDGTVFHCQHTIAPLWNDQGDVIAYMSSQRDVTIQMKAEHALRESEEKYRQIVETAHEGIWVLNGDARTAFVNPRMAEMLGCLQEEMVGSSFYDYLEEAGQELVRQAWDRMLYEGKAVFDLCYRRKAGGGLWCHVSFSVITDDQGGIKGVMALLTDISEQRKLTEALIRSQKMEAVGQLTGGIAHDFNNILGSILGFTELAQARCSGFDPKLSEYLGQIGSAGGRARDLIRQLLIFSRGENTGAAAPIPLVPLIKEIIKMLKPMLPVEIEINTVLPQDSPSVKVDPLHVQQLLMNLCINARDAIGRKGRITIGVVKRSFDNARCAICSEPIAGDWVAIQVADNGRGIEASIRDDIFQPFVTSKEVGEGSGMGLAVVRGIVNSYNGHLVVESSPGQGAVFKILLHEALLEGEGQDRSTPDAALSSE
ncbi:MAG: PAS domain S-box protein [Candidatus Thiodiazotropha sp.]